MSSLDDRIRKEVKDALDREMKELSLDINVDTKDGYVTLSGIVDTLGEKRAAEEIVTTVKDVKGVENNMTICTDGYTSDKDIETEVMNKLKGTGVSVSVDDGIATLCGNVETLKDEKKAIFLAQKALGVKDVVSNINISSSGRFDDATIANKLTQRLSETHLSIPDIFASVNNGMVRLSGHVDTREDMELAVEIAEEIEGVKKVVNGIKIR